MTELPHRTRGGLSVVPGGGDRRAAPREEPAPAPRPTPLTPGTPAVLGSVPGPELVPPPRLNEHWTDAQADAWLAARDLVGWRFALDRIHKLLHALGDPHLESPAIHVVGTNGKSSTTRMVAALLAAHGRKPGAFLSPHLTDLRERIEVAGSPVPPEAHAEAVADVARAAAGVDQPGDPVTQFEAHTAAAFVAMAEAECDVFVVEAGLGGRLDSTNVLGASVVALTSVDLEHTALLGDSIEAITAEKVAVVTPGAVLVLGADLSDAATIVARDHAARVGAQVITAKPEPLDRALGAAYQARNFALARAVCEAYLGALDLRIVREVARSFTMPARFEEVATEPITILDGAHNPAGAVALAASLGEAGLKRGGVAVVSVLADKDAAGIVRALSERVDRYVLCDCGSPRALPPEELAQIVRQTVPAARIHTIASPEEALTAARAAAGADAFVVVCGTLALARTIRTVTGVSA
ncbi:MAG: hypothetical protein JHD16_04185 [Solirubrobacteraceae bacterium]|nr:hypothetical protein [Solirubrobacteraceae bacterium]